MEDAQEDKKQEQIPTSEDVPAMQYKPFYLKTKIEDMMKYGKKAVASFPRRERQTADEIRKTMLEMYRLSIMIERKYFKKTTLQELDVNLEILRHLVRLAADKDYYDNEVVKRRLRTRKWTHQLPERSMRSSAGGWRRRTRGRTSVYPCWRTTREDLKL